MRITRKEGVIKKMSITDIIKRIWNKLFKTGYTYHEPIHKRYGPLKFIFKTGYGLSVWAEKKTVKNTTNF